MQCFLDGQIDVDKVKNGLNKGKAYARRTKRKGESDNGER